MSVIAVAAILLFTMITFTFAPTVVNTARVSGWITRSVSDWNFRTCWFLFLTHFYSGLIEVEKLSDRVQRRHPTEFDESVHFPVFSLEILEKSILF